MGRKIVEFGPVHDEIMLVFWPVRTIQSAVPFVVHLYHGNKMNERDFQHEKQLEHKISSAIIFVWQTTTANMRLPENEIDQASRTDSVRSGWSKSCIRSSIQERRSNFSEKNLQTKYRQTDKINHWKLRTTDKRSETLRPKPISRDVTRDDSIPISVSPWRLTIERGKSATIESINFWKWKNYRQNRQGFWECQTKYRQFYIPVYVSL